MGAKREGPDLYIRAQQGHSVKGVLDDEKLLRRIERVEDLPGGICVHGTTMEAWGTIRTQGLSPMGRQHVHMATQELGSSAMVSGMRNSSQVSD